jgi:hypothetical protein
MGLYGPLLTPPARSAPSDYIAISRSSRTTTSNHKKPCHGVSEEEFASVHGSYVPHPPAYSKLICPGLRPAPMRRPRRAGSIAITFPKGSVCHVLAAFRGEQAYTLSTLDTYAV